MSNKDAAEFFLKKFNRHDDIDRRTVVALQKEFEKFGKVGDTT